MQTITTVSPGRCEVMPTDDEYRCTEVHYHLLLVDITYFVLNEIYNFMYYICISLSLSIISIYIYTIYCGIWHWVTLCTKLKYCLHSEHRKWLSGRLYIICGINRDYNTNTNIRYLLLRILYLFIFT